MHILTILRWLVPATTMAVALATSVALAAGADIPRDPGATTVFRGDNGRSGVIPGEWLPDSPALRWSYQATGPFTTGPVVAGERVIATTGRGLVMALGLRDGALRWSAELGGGTPSTPAIAGDLAVIGTRMGGVVALHVTDGSRAWVAEPGEAVVGTPAVTDAGVVVATTDGAALLLDPVSGSERWRTQVGGSIERSTSVAGDLVVLPVEPGELVGLDLATGRERWRARIAQSGGVGTPVTIPGTVLGAAGLDAHGAVPGADPSERALVALDPTTGAVRWTYQRASQAIVYTPATDGETAWVVSEDGAVVALDVTTGSVRWEAATKGVNEVPPLLVGDVVLVPSNDGAVHAFAAEDGTERWVVPIAGVPFTPAVAAGILLVPTALGQLTAFGPPS